LDIHTLTLLVRGCNITIGDQYVIVCNINFFKVCLVIKRHGHLFILDFTYCYITKHTETIHWFMYEMMQDKLLVPVHFS